MFANFNKILYLIIFIAVFLFIFKVFIKFLPIIIVFIAILCFPYQKMLEKLSGLFIKKKDYEHVSGKIYKQCSYCQKRADRKALKCDFCGKPFE